MLARELSARGHDVRVATFRPSYQEARTTAPRAEQREGVDVRRCWTPRSNKGLLSRVIAARWIAGISLWRALFSSGRRVLVIPSSPPTLGMVGWWLWWLRRQPYIYVLHDIHPDLGEALGRWPKGGILSRMLERVNRKIMRRARTVVTLSEGMARNARAKQPQAHIEIIENWAELDKLVPQPKGESSFAREQGLVEPFVVQYSGNLGLLHPLEALTRGAGALAPENVVLAFIGRGARLAATREVARNYPNVRFFDYQPLETLGDSLAACDVAAVALEPGADGLAMPSKIPGILAAGRPLLALAPAQSEIARLVEGEGVGVVVHDTDDAKAVSAAIRILKADNEGRAAMGTRARALAERRFGLKRAVDAYERLLGSD